MKGAILLINGPNLNLLGTREPEIYGDTTLADIENKLKTKLSAVGLELVAYQSNQEGQLVDFIHEHQTAKFAIINAGAFTHTSVALRDAIKGVGLNFVEVHISNVHAREEFRQKSYLSDIAQGIIVGCGVQGYELAADFIIAELGH
ncbi:MAG: type II 3-dehydroquinate dehydratase [SAR324 cluster bacterium]|nr:type II 3-dehydroquinate dehydratase [SAR324 cluster bacterium]